MQIWKYEKKVVSYKKRVLSLPSSQFTMFFHALTLAGVVLSVFLIVLICSKKHLQASDKVLVCWLAVVGVQLLFYYDNLSSHPLIPGFLGMPLFALPLLSAGILFLYVRSIAAARTITIREIIPVTVPYIVYILVCSIVQSYNNSVIELRNGIPYFPSNIKSLLPAFTWPLAIIPGYFSVVSLLILQRYRRSLPHHFSYTERINLNWLRGVVFSYIVLFAVLYWFIRYNITHQVSIETLFAVVGTFMTGYVFFMGYFGFRQTTLLAVAPTAASEELPKTGYANTGLTVTMAEVLHQKLIGVMAVERPYLDEELTLTGLAQQLNISTNHLSQVINQQAGTNFFNFVNAYRVTEMKLRLKDPAFSHYSILAIGIHCGFKSKSSMNKVFKEMTGMTPSEYQKS
jgi:AraC-like DNA-binding protein